MHEPGIDRDALDLEIAGDISGCLEGTQEVAGMQYANDIFRLSAPERQPRIRRGRHLPDQFLRRQIGVEGKHFRPVDHDVRDFEVAKFEQAAEHVAIGPRHTALAMQEIDGTFQLFVA